MRKKDALRNIIDNFDTYVNNGVAYVNVEDYLKAL